MRGRVRGAAEETATAPWHERATAVLRATRRPSERARRDRGGPRPRWSRAGPARRRPGDVRDDRAHDPRDRRVDASHVQRRAVREQAAAALLAERAGVRGRGASTFTAILLPGLLGVVCTLLVYWLVRRTLDGWETAFLAAIVYATTPGGGALEPRGPPRDARHRAGCCSGSLAAHRSVAEPSAVLWLALAAIGGWFAKGPQGLFPVAVALVLWGRAECSRGGCCRSRAS